MVQFGNSRVPKISSIIVTGEFIGPTGPTGSTGATGNYSTGPAGPTGKYIKQVRGLSANTIRVVYNTGNFTDISGVRGATGDAIIGDFSVGFTGFTSSSVYAVNYAGGLTLYFKSIELIGQITGSYASSDLVISGSTSLYTGSLIPNRLIYIGYSYDTETFFNLKSATNAIYSEDFVSGLTYSSLEVLFYGYTETGYTKNFNYSVHESDNFIDYTGITLNINSSVYGFTYDEFGNYSQGYLKYSVNYPSLTESGTTKDFIQFKPKQYYSKFIGSNTNAPLNESIGSCCYCDVQGNRYCIEYVNKNYCTNMLAGAWSPSPCYLRYNTDDCYQGGACCVNGRCISCSKDKCYDYGGLFVPGQNCSSISGCPDICALTGCCCIKGVGYPLTAELCSEVEGSRFFDSECSSVDCCRVGYLGACCVRKICYDNFSAYECAVTGGVYQGVGSVCASQFINCCTDPNQSSNSAILARAESENPQSIPFDDPRWNLPPLLPDGNPNPDWPGWDVEVWPDFVNPFSPFYRPDIKDFFKAPGDYFRIPGYDSPINVPALTPVDRGIPPAYILPDGKELYWDGSTWWVRSPGEFPQWRFNPPNSFPVVPPDPWREPWEEDVDSYPIENPWIPWIPDGYGVPIIKYPYGGDEYFKTFPEWWVQPTYPRYPEPVNPGEDTGEPPQEESPTPVPIIPPRKLRRQPPPERFFPIAPPTSGDEIEYLKDYPDWRRGPYYYMSL